MGMRYDDAGNIIAVGDWWDVKYSYMLFAQNLVIMITSIGSICSVAFFNFCGVSVTKRTCTPVITPHTHPHTVSRLHPPPRPTPRLTSRPPFAFTLASHSSDLGHEPHDDRCVPYTPRLDRQHLAWLGVVRLRFA